MTETKGQYLHISDVPKQYETSRRTVERRRKKAREANHHAVLENFVVITSDGHEYPNPTDETVRSLTSQSRKPEWHIKRDWLDQNFRKRRDNDATQESDKKNDQEDDATRPRHKDPIVAALLGELDVKNKQIADLSQTIQSLALTHEAMLRLADKHPQTSEHRQQSDHNSPQVIEVKPQPVEQKPRPESEPKAKPKTTNKQTQKQRTASTKTKAKSKPEKQTVKASSETTTSRFRRFLFGGK